MPQLYRRTEKGLVIHLRVTPGASRDGIEGPEERADGTMVLRVKVRAQPERGKANAAVIALLAKSLGVSRSALAVTVGHSARLKTVLIERGDLDGVVDRLDALIGPSGQDAAGQ